MLCKDVMSRKVFVCHETDSAGECARIMRDHGVGFLPVLDAERLVSGVVTDRDLAVRVLAEGRSPRSPVSDFMTRDVRVSRATDTLRAAERRMAAVKKSRLVVVDDQRRCVGVISLSDVAQTDSRPLAGHVLYEVTRRRTTAAPPRGV